MWINGDIPDRQGGRGVVPNGWLIHSARVSPHPVLMATCCAACVDTRLRLVLRQNGGIVRRADVNPLWLLRNAVRGGLLTSLFPNVYVETERLGSKDRQHLLYRAALRYLDHQGAISHLTALAVWQLREPLPNEPVHVTVSSTVRLRAAKGIIAHHYRDFGPGRYVNHGGFAVTSASVALVDSWPLLPITSRVGVAIKAFEARLATADQVREHLSRLPKLTGGPGLRTIADLIASGCRSPLEIWGALQVFIGPEFAKLRRQEAVTVSGRLFYLDLYAEEEKVAFELDGAAWHGSQAQRERDIRRDAALATLGILVVRYSYRRLRWEPELVRREAIAILASRRASHYQ
ncbi:MAG TPA: hypothetical protein DGG94_20555 [Micromonosporaceae bacterium]|nr:hypothetical protein [Micromonosporaceae bacterium]HCU52155.1 hypothetical protein [Micromonosporaceae bacterium]